jgi:cell wall-associated NlpC family hydrolase
MYIGKGKMIHATNPRSGVRIDSINMGYYKARYAGAGRIIKH